MTVRPPTVTVPYGTRVVLHVVNHGTMSHDLQLGGGSVGTGLLAPGQGRTVSYWIFGQTTQAWCAIPGHKAAGMILTVTVSGAPAGPAAAGTAAAGRAGRDAVIDFGATPLAGWRPDSAARRWRPHRAALSTTSPSPPRTGG
jgi:nitrite reductase (NO-forming)